MIGIYKITNKNNNKSYIGQSIHVEKRLSEHKSPYNHKREHNKLLYKAFFKHGIENFSFEVIEECDKEELDVREEYWISYYDSYKNGYNATVGGETNFGENHPNHKLTKQDVIDIRTRYANLERKKEVYLDYNNRIGESGFGKIWKGETWVQIMPEVYSEKNKEFHAHNTANSGSSNGRSRLKEEDVIDIRIRRKNGEKMREVYEDYKDLLTLGSFSNVWTYQNWKKIIV